MRESGPYRQHPHVALRAKGRVSSLKADYFVTIKVKERTTHVSLDAPQDGCPVPQLYLVLSDLLHNIQILRIGDILPLRRRRGDDIGRVRDRHLVTR